MTAALEPPHVSRLTAREWLTDVIGQLTAAAIVVPCVGSPLWISESASERAEAVEGCATCLAAPACSDAALEVRPSFGVWAGRDYALDLETERRRRGLR